jgi:hypothetical protein
MLYYNFFVFSSLLTVGMPRVCTCMQSVLPLYGNDDNNNTTACWLLLPPNDSPPSFLPRFLLAQRKSVLLLLMREKILFLQLTLARRLTRNEFFSCTESAFLGYCQCRDD